MSLFGLFLGPQSSPPPGASSGGGNSGGSPNSPPVIPSITLQFDITRS